MALIILVWYLSTEYAPEPTHSYEDENTASAYDPYAPGPTVVTMMTEEPYPYGTTTETYDYAKEDKIETSQVPYDNDGSSEEVLEEEGPTECDCQPGEPGFAGFAGPKVRITHFISLKNVTMNNDAVYRCSVAPLE